MNAGAAGRAPPFVRDTMPSTMFEITAANAESYLRDRGWVGPGPVTIVPLAGGVSNVVFRVENGGKRFVLKQSRPQLRTRDAWFSDVTRIHREVAVMQALADLLPPLTVPSVLHVDRDHFAYAMSHAPPAAVWKEALLAGIIDPALGERTGRVLGMMHEASSRLRERFEGFAERSAFLQLRIEPFYQRVQGRRPEVAAALQVLVDEMLTRTEALCHGDYTPKNLLIHGHGFTLVDYETCHFGEP
ncbi:MAG: aminoglycoside phosphotransferase family protein, partial [Gemmataceae bacterium]|nr:aminoglycoside phosphotransferase family protein [Gemmataceae bacterium]